jgi:aspartate/methionine/tyrosine aminotransferase
MKIAAFETEHFFARHEFSTPYQLCNSDCESLSISELLAMSGDSLEAFGRQRLVYTESQGNPELRQAIADMHKEVHRDDVIMLGTPVEGIYLAARALLEPDDEVIVLSPAYDALTRMFEHVLGEAQVKRWSFRPSDDHWQLDLNDLRKQITPETRMVIVNFPHNPTGYLPTVGFLQELVELVQKHGLLLFSDEMYFGLVQPDAPLVPSVADLTKSAVALSGLSKTYGLPGLRCGWLIARDESLRENIMNWKYYTSICPPGPTEYLATAALRVGEELRKRNIARIANNLALAEAFFARWPDLFHWRRPSAGSTALVGFAVPSVSALSEMLANEEGILIQSAQMLGGTDQQMRIGLGRDGFSQALEKFEDWLKGSGLGSL